MRLEKISPPLSGPVSCPLDDLISIRLFIHDTAKALQQSVIIAISENMMSPLFSDTQKSTIYMPRTVTSTVKSKGFYLWGERYK